jgi:hypothetical protein
MADLTSELEKLINLFKSKGYRITEIAGEEEERENTLNPEREFQLGDNNFTITIKLTK